MGRAQLLYSCCDVKISKGQHPITKRLSNILAKGPDPVKNLLPDNNWQEDQTQLLSCEQIKLANVTTPNCLAWLHKKLALGPDPIAKPLLHKS